MNSYSPFTENQVNYFNGTQNSWLNVAEGGKRGGKNVLQTLAYCINLENHPDKLHLIAGVSGTTARLNILDCDGFGLSNYFYGRCREGKYKDRSCLYAQTRTGEKIILVSGGGKKGDEKLIKGNTYGTAYITESNECAPTFLKEVMDRTLSSRDRKIFHDLNPKSPGHWYYADIIDFHARKQTENSEYGYNYGHFTIADNLSVSDEKLKIILNTYDKSSIWYKRDILGQRKQVEGAIYPVFNANKKDYLIDSINPQDLMLVKIGIDFGGNKSASTFVAVGFTRGYEQTVVLDEEYRPAATEDPESLNKGWILFAKRILEKYPNVRYADGDNAEKVLLRGLINTTKKERLPIVVRDAQKGMIINRIRLTNMLISQKRLKILKHCEHIQKAFEEAIWDEKEVEDKRLDDGTFSVDMLDAFEYAIETEASKLERFNLINRR